MICNIFLRAAVFAAAIVSATLTVSVQPANAFLLAGINSCDSPVVLRAISHRFSIADRNVIRRGLAVDQYHDIHQNKYTPASDTVRTARRYCHAKVTMNDGRTRTLWFLIESGQGFAGIGDNVEYCISGLDPWHVNGAYCRSVR